MSNNNTPNSFIKDIKLKTENIVSNFITNEEIQNKVKEEESSNTKKQKTEFIEKYLKDKVVKIIIQDINNNNIKSIFKAYCQFENNMLSFSPEKIGENQISVPDILLNPDYLNYDFTIPGNGMDNMWHLTPFY